MGRRAAKETTGTEKKMELIALADTLVDLADKLDCQNAKALTADYADDEPRKEAVRGLDDLHRGLYGILSDRVHTQVTFIMTKTAEQEKLDRANDALKQGERQTIDAIKEAARNLRNEVMGRPRV